MECSESWGGGDQGPTTMGALGAAPACSSWPCMQLLENKMKNSSATQEIHVIFISKLLPTSCFYFSLFEIN